MRYDRLSTLAIAAAAALVLFVSAPSFADPAIDCSTMQSLSGKSSYQANIADVRNCVNRGWPVPPGWVPDGGKGAGITAGGSGGFSYGNVKAPESPPGSRNENASVSAAAIKASCNFPPRIKVGFPPSINMPAGSCLNFALGLFKDSAGGTISSAPPVGVDAGDACPADSNDAALYGVRQTATGTIPLSCGGMVPVVTADLTLNSNPTSLATTSAGTYKLWVYHKSGSNYSGSTTGYNLPTYLCGAHDFWGNPIKTVDLTAPTEQQISYNSGDKYIYLRLQPRVTMPSGYIPPYVSTDPERYLVIPVDSAGNPSVPSTCGGTGDWRVNDNKYQDVLVQSATIPATICPAGNPVQVNYPVCTNGAQPIAAAGPIPAHCADGSTPHSHYIAICNAGSPEPSFADIILPVSGICPNQATTTCTPSPAATDGSCDVVSMPLSASACTSLQQFSALNRPGIYYPPGSTASFFTITGRTQLMAQNVANSRLFMQSNTLVTLEKLNTPITFNEGGTITLHNPPTLNNYTLIMQAPATITLTSSGGTVSMPNGGKLVSSGGVLVTTFNAGGTYNLPAAPPYVVNANRSMTLPAGFQVPTIAATTTQPAYVQLPVTIVQ